MIYTYLKSVNTSILKSQTSHPRERGSNMNTKMSITINNMIRAAHLDLDELCFYSYISRPSGHNLEQGFLQLLLLYLSQRRGLAGNGCQLFRASGTVPRTVLLFSIVVLRTPSKFQHALQSVQCEVPYLLSFHIGLFHHDINDIESSPFVHSSIIFQIRA